MEKLVGEPGQVNKLWVHFSRGFSKKNQNIWMVTRQMVVLFHQKDETGFFFFNSKQTFKTFSLKMMKEQQLFALTVCPSAQPRSCLDRSCSWVKTSIKSPSLIPPFSPSNNNHDAKICGSLSLNYFTANHDSVSSKHNLATLRTGVNVQLLVACVLKKNKLKDYRMLAQT